MSHRSVLHVYAHASEQRLKFFSSQDATKGFCLSCKLFEVGVADVPLKINFYKEDYIKDTAGDKKKYFLMSFSDSS